MAAVTIEYDWDVKRKYRFESFCYGPVSCQLYKMGPPRGVPFKNGRWGSDTVYDDGWMDELCVEGRGADEWETESDDFDNLV